jgi:uncharacterized protein YegL
MYTPVPLILKTEPVPRIRLAFQQLRRPAVSVVYGRADGRVEMKPRGRPMKWWEQLVTLYRTRYEVDLSDHQRQVELQTSPPRAAGEIYAFKAVLDVSFRVQDPAEIVRRNIQDGMVPVGNHLIFVCREITAQFAIEDAQRAEEAVNQRFQFGEMLPEGIFIFRLRARFTPDEAARAYLSARNEAGRTNIVKAAQHVVDVDDVGRVTELRRLAQYGDLELRFRERWALSGRPTTPEELVRMHLETNPQDTVRAYAMLAELEQGRFGQQLKADERWQKMFELMVENGLVRPNDIAPIRDRTVARLAPPPVPLPQWDDPLPDQGGRRPDATAALPGIIPVYVVLDESLERGTAELNESLRQLCLTLASAPRVADVVRLSVFGYGDVVDVAMRLATVTGTTPVPTLPQRRPVSYGPAFQTLLDWIPDDITALKSQNNSVRRPQVFFLSGAEPVDHPRWTEPYGHLVDRTRLHFAPDIMAFGVGQAPPPVIASIATRPGLAFVDSGVDLADAILRFGTFIRDHVLRHGQAVLDGDAPLVTAPPGFTAAH